MGLLVAGLKIIFACALSETITGVGHRSKNVLKLWHWTAKMRPHFRDMLRLVLRRYARPAE